ncbi:MAG: IS3 family transposase [Euryarchaeota archaeon]|nr:IS3 family transposase [Euryarchaeota archaeon]
MPLIEETIRDTRRRVRWPTRLILARLGVPKASYYRWRKTSPLVREERPPQPFEILPEEREAVLCYGREHPKIRHRELAWRMVDEDVAYVSKSIVYRILNEEGLIAEWQQYRREKRLFIRAEAPDVKWQSDITYIKLGGRNYYLITFIDAYSRYITYWDLLTRMDGDSVSLAAEAALGRLAGGKMPIIQTDNGSGYISRDFKIVLNRRGITHHRIRPHTPTDNAIVERVEKTIKAELQNHEPETPDAARLIIEGIIRWYNHERLHSSIDFLPPWVMYRGNPQEVLERRRVKLAAARHRRRELNLRRRQSRLYLEQGMTFTREPESQRNEETRLSHSC